MTKEMISEELKFWKSSRVPVDSPAFSFKQLQNPILRTCLFSHRILSSHSGGVWFDVVWDCRHLRRNKHHPGGGVFSVLVH